MYCRNCKTQLDAKAAACTSCGLRPYDGTSYCHNCGSDTAEKAVVCVSCGVDLRSATEKNKAVAALLAILLGGLGAHKFYLGRPGMGIVYLLFCWTFIPALVSPFEGIWYLVMSEHAFAKKFAG